MAELVHRHQDYVHGLGKHTCQIMCRALLFLPVVCFAFIVALVFAVGALVWGLEHVAQFISAHVPSAHVPELPRKIKSLWSRFAQCMTEANEWWTHNTICRFDSQRDCKLCREKEREWLN